MFELLIIRGSFDEHKDWKACARVWSSHIELQAAASLFQVAASFPVYYLTIWASRVQVKLLQTIPTKEINPPPQERTNSHIELEAVTFTVCSALLCNIIKYYCHSLGSAAAAAAASGLVH